MPETDPSPILESEFQVASLISWARGQPNFLVHPAVVARGNRLAVSMPVSAGTPLIGVKSEGYFHEMLELPNADGVATDSEAECHRLTKLAEKPEMWPLRLAVRLLKEANDPESPWEAYVQSTAIRPQTPMLWSVTQANELQYLPTKRLVKEQLLELRSFHEANLASSPLGPSKADLLAFAALVSTAAARGIEVEDGRRALLPLVDLVCPPEGAVAAAEAPRPPSCKLELEEDLAVVTAAHDLPSGEVLTRDHGLSHEELLLRHGLAAAGGVKDDVVLWAAVRRQDAKPWQLRELRRSVATEPGVSEGDLIVRSSVKRGKKLSEAIGRGLIHASRVLVCERESGLHGVAEWARDERKASKGLAGLGSEQRRGCIANLVHAIEGYQKTFDTTAEQDEQMLQTVHGNWKVAVAYRLEKKRVLQDVLAVLERAKDREVEKRARVREEAHLPAAVTGRKASPESRSFKRGGLGGAGAGEGKSAKGDEPKITKGARVEILKGKFEGTVGVVATELNSLGSVTLQLDNGSRVDYVSLDNLKLLEPAPQEEAEAAAEQEPEGGDASSPSADEATKSDPKTLEFSAPPEKEGSPTERIAEAIARDDLDAIFDVVLEDTEKTDDQVSGSPVEVEVVDAEATPVGEKVAEPAPAAPEASATEEAPAAQAVAGPEGTPEVAGAESVEVADAEPTTADEVAKAAAEPEPAPADPREGGGVGGEDSAGGSSAEVSGLADSDDLADVDGLIRQMKATLQTLEMRKVVLAMQAAGVEEEKVQQVVMALGEQD